MRRRPWARLVLGYPMSDRSDTYNTRDGDAAMACGDAARSSVCGLEEDEERRRGCTGGKADRIPYLLMGWSHWVGSSTG